MSSPIKKGRDERPFDPDPTVICLSDVAFDEFVRLLDSPPPPSAELLRLMATRPPWHEDAPPRR